jgi:hypothetical protein
MNTDNLRKHPRFDSIQLSYICLDKSEEVVQQAMARTINISESGILMETHFKIEKGQSLVASIGLRDELVDVRGKVAHVQATDEGKYVIGIEITGIESGDEDLLQNFLQKISETEPGSSTEQ